MEPPTDTSRILEKGPNYLRKQMELEGETKAGLSAVERLAASKPKYVKTQRVIRSKQVPAISFSSGSGSSHGSSKRCSRRSKENKDEKVSAQPNSEEQGERTPPDGANIVRRSSSKRQRPDSLLMYRQKCELLKGPINENAKKSLALGIILNSLKDKPISLPEATVSKTEVEEIDFKAMRTASFNTRAQETQLSVKQSKPRHNRVKEIELKSRKGVARSHSDVSSRYSKNFADYEIFFKYCGLDGDVIESLGKENFSARSDDLTLKMRSVSVSTSEDGFSKESGDSDGLMEEEVRGKIPQGTSVIERNARIIKWLYSCKNAQESGKTLRDLD